MRKRTLVATLAALLVLLAALAFFAARQRVSRHIPFRAAKAAGQTSKEVATAPLSVERWSEQFRELESTGNWTALDQVLSSIARDHSDLYTSWSLGYLHARALLELGRDADSAAKLAPFLRPGSPFRELALFHQSEIDDAKGKKTDASRSRMELINGSASPYREEAIDDEAEYRSGLSDAAALAELAARVAPGASTARRRDLEARIIEVQARTDLVAASNRGFALLRGGTMDDAADRVSSVLDRPDLVSHMTGAQLETLGEALRNHRHYERAEVVLSRALQVMPTSALVAVAKQPQPAVARPSTKKPASTKKPVPAKKPASVKKASVKKASAKKVPAPTKQSPVKRPVKTSSPKPVAAVTPPTSRDDLLFALGRSYFGDEKFAEAQQIYRTGAETSRDPRARVTFLWHAARSAQLVRQDSVAESLMTSAVAVPVRTDASSAALVQRLRTRLMQKRMTDATADLGLIRRLMPRDHAVVDGSLAIALTQLASGSPAGARTTLDAIPPQLCDKSDRVEIAYWRGRSLEASDPHAAILSYLEVLRSDQPTHFPWFVRARLAAQPLAALLPPELALRDDQVKALAAGKQFELARRVATDRVLLSTRDRAAALSTLRGIYEKLPAYAAVLHLAPSAIPAFPLSNPDRYALLVAMGLFDEAAPEALKRYPLHPASSALTLAMVLNRGGASKDSIYAIEVLMNGLPADYEPDLLPPLVRELLHPRDFETFVNNDSKAYGADPVLVLSVMREESRFNPRAKSEAAARGLMQFIITTAAEIGREVGIVEIHPEDLYDPRVIIRLGARYLATLTSRFDGDRYKAAAAYNAGPIQVQLWSRFAPAPGDDYFLSTINFDETKNYVRKVMNSYREYESVYAAP